MRAEVLRRHTARDGQDPPRVIATLSAAATAWVSKPLPSVLLHQCVVGLHDLVLKELLATSCQIYDVLGNRNRLSLFSAVRRHIGAHVQDI